MVLGAVFHFFILEKGLAAVSSLILNRHVECVKLEAGRGFQGPLRLHEISALGPAFITVEKYVLDRVLILLCRAFIHLLRDHGQILIGEELVQRVRRILGKSVPRRLVKAMLALVERLGDLKERILDLGH